MLDKKIEVYEIKIKKATLYIKVGNTSLSLDEIKEQMGKVVNNKKHTSVNLTTISEKKYNKMERA